MKFRLLVIFLLVINFLCLADVIFNEPLVVPDAWNGRHSVDYWLTDNNEDGTDELFICYGDHNGFYNDWYVVEYSLAGDTLSVITLNPGNGVSISRCRMYKTESADYLILVFNREYFDQEVCDLEVYDFPTMELLGLHSNYNFFTEFGNEFDTNYIELAEDNDNTYLYLGLTYGYDTYLTRERFYTTKMVKYSFDEGDIDFIEEVEGCGKEMMFCSATEPMFAMGYSMYSEVRGYSYTFNRVFHDYPATVEELLSLPYSSDPRTNYLTKNDHHYPDYGMVIYETYNHQFHCYSPDFSEILWEETQGDVGYYGVSASTCISAQEGDHFLLNFYPYTPNNYLEIIDRTNGNVLLTQEIEFSPDEINEGSYNDLYFSYYEDDFWYFYTLAEEINISNNSNEITACHYNMSNSPNPFNPITLISYSIPSDSKVDINIYNIKGQKIKTLVSEHITLGDHSVIWDGNNDMGAPVSSGVYFYSLNIDGIKKADNKCLLLK